MTEVGDVSASQRVESVGRARLAPGFVAFVGAGAFPHTYGMATNAGLLPFLAVEGLSLRRIGVFALLVLLATPLALSAQRPPTCWERGDTTAANQALRRRGNPPCPVIADFPPDWNLSQSRVAGLPRFSLDSSYRGWLPLDSIRTMAGGFNFTRDYPVCSDSLGRTTIDPSSPDSCWDRFYLLIGHTTADGSFFGYRVSDGPVSVFPEPPPPWRWGMTWQRLGRRFTAYPVEGRISGNHLSWVVNYGPGSRQECESLRALDDGRVEGSCRLTASAVRFIPPGWTNRFRLERLRGRPILDP